MLKDDQPVAPDLAVAVGDADRYIDRLTFLSVPLTRWML